MNSLSLITFCQLSKAGSKLNLLKLPCRWSKQVHVSLEGAGKVCASGLYGSADAGELALLWYLDCLWLCEYAWGCGMCKAKQCLWGFWSSQLFLFGSGGFQQRPPTETLKEESFSWNAREQDRHSTSFSVPLWSCGVFEFLFTYKRITTVQKEFLEWQDTPS